MHENKQIQYGEFGDFHGEIAKLLTAEEFARRFSAAITRGQYLDRVTVGKIDYFWSKEGVYDGHGGLTIGENQ